MSARSTGTVALARFGESERRFRAKGGEYLPEGSACGFHFPGSEKWALPVLCLAGGVAFAPGSVNHALSSGLKQAA